MNSQPPYVQTMNDLQDDWVLLQSDWWYTPVSAFDLPPASFATALNSMNDAEADTHNDSELASQLPGVRFAEEVLRFYETDVGFSVANSPSNHPMPFKLAEPALPPDTNSDDIERTNRAAWADYLCSLDDDDDLVSPSLSSSVITHRSTSVDLTSDSERSAIYSSMPSTPRATDPQVFIKEHSPHSDSNVSEAVSDSHGTPFPIISSDPPLSPIVPFKFPSLNSPMEITRDEDGFIVPTPDAKPSSEDRVDVLLPPFLLDPSPKSKTASRSKTRTIVDRLRSSSREPSEDSTDDSVTPSVHDLSFIRPRLGATSPDVDEDDSGWIGSALHSASGASSQEDSLMARANRARAAFLQSLRRNKDKSTSVLPSKIKGKAKFQDDRSSSKAAPPRLGQLVAPNQDQDGWIEFPSLNSNKAKLSSTKDTLHRRSPSRSNPSKRVPSNGLQGQVSHRRTSSHHPSPPPPPPVSQIGLLHRPSTSGTFIFPPPISQQQAPPPQWTLPMAPAAPGAAPVFTAPPPFFHHQRAPSIPTPMMGGQQPMPTPGGWFMPSPPLAPPAMVSPMVPPHLSLHHMPRKIIS